uniref:Homeobox domain-containing protein n=3 Tax=Onchocercidae TaxID=6296 RepID=A0A1I7VKD2_LOALO
MSMFPVRVVVESVRPQHCLTCARDGHMLVDSYAIVSGATLLSQLVDTVLSALGMPQLAVNSKGLVQVANWKALPFDQITDNLDDTVESLLKDISNHITLKILTKQSSTDASSSQCISDLRQRLLKAAITKQPHILSTVDNQQIKDLILQVVAGDEPSMLNFDQIQAINEWLEQLDDNHIDRKSPYITRFNHLLEIPKLERWFCSDANPSRQKLINYMNVLNGSSYRRHNAKVTYQQICNWFANQRAANRKSPQSNHTTITHCPPSVAQSSILLPPQSHSSPSGEFRPKFDFNSLLDSKQANGSTSERIEGGSESPTPNDDVSVHSASDCGFDQVSVLKQNSATSSPEISFDLNGGHASVSPKPAGGENVGHHQVTSNGSGNGNSTAGQPQQTPSNTVARSRLMFDPLTELPVLEKWFEENPHPTWLQIDHYTEALNSCQYRQSYPPISTHNVKIWFKNRRAKCKRMQTGDLNLKMMI